MIIDRHNYEECFILYWDNELNASQKQAVENFVTQNPDLQDEFKMLGETRFTPDDSVRLEEKEFLLNDSFVNITNFQEHLLNYIDDEVSNEERKEIERSIASNPSVQKELAVLLKTKLQPESETVFPDKSTLYKREEKVRIISLTWFRVAVAAAIILVAGLTTLRLTNSNKGGNIPSVANIDNPAKQTPGQNADQPMSKLGEQAKKSNEEAVVINKEKTNTTQTTPEEKSKKRDIGKDLSGSSIAYERENKNNLPVEGKKADKTLAGEKPGTEEVIAAVDIPNLSSKDLDRAEKYDQGNTNKLFNNSSVTDDTRFTSDIVVDDTESKEKGGIKEFLRKTTRVFERRTKIQTTTEDNKLLIGAFAVSLK